MYIEANFFNTLTLGELREIINSDDFSKLPDDTKIIIASKHEHPIVRDKKGLTYSNVSTIIINGDCVCINTTI